MTFKLIRKTQQTLVRKSLVQTMGLSKFYFDVLDHRATLSQVEVQGFRLMVKVILSGSDFKPPHSTSIEPVNEDVDGTFVRGEWVRASLSGDPKEGTLLYIHGGGFIGGSAQTHRGLVSELSDRTGMPAFSAAYRLAPRHPFPAGADDILQTYRWMLDQGIPAERIAVLGDSAGGHFALGLPARAVRAGLPAPGAVVGLSPVADPALPASIERDRIMKSPVLSGKAAKAFMASYRGPHLIDHPELALINDDLSVMPPTLIHIAEGEFLAADAELLASAIDAAGGTVKLTTWPDTQHAFQIAHKISSKSSTAVDEIAEFVREHIHASADA